MASLADEVQFQLSQEGIEPYHTEGFDSKNWILLDYSGVIVHVFVPGTRTYYDLEHLWADAETVGRLAVAGRRGGRRAVKPCRGKANGRVRPPMRGPGRMYSKEKNGS